MEMIRVLSYTSLIAHRPIVLRIQGITTNYVGTLLMSFLDSKQLNCSSEEVINKPI